MGKQQTLNGITSCPHRLATLRFLPTTPSLLSRNRIKMFKAMSHTIHQPLYKKPRTALAISHLWVLWLALKVTIRQTACSQRHLVLVLRIYQSAHFLFPNQIRWPTFPTGHNPAALGGYHFIQPLSISMMHVPWASTSLLSLTMLYVLPYNGTECCQSLFLVYITYPILPRNASYLGFFCLPCLIPSNNDSMY